MFQVWVVWGRPSLGIWTNVVAIFPYERRIEADAMVASNPDVYRLRPAMLPQAVTFIEGLAPVEAKTK